MGWQQDYSKCICEPLFALDPPPGGGGNTAEGNLAGVCGFLPPGTTGTTGGDTGGTGDTGWSGWTLHGTHTGGGDIIEPWEFQEIGGGGGPAAPGPAAPPPVWNAPPPAGGGGAGTSGPITGGPIKGPITGGGGGPTTGEPTGPAGIAEIIRSSNLPGQIVYENPFASLAKNVDIPIPQRDTAVPQSIQQVIDDEEVPIPDANRNYAVVDPAYSVEVDTNQERLSFANMQGKSSGGDPNNIFGNSYNLTLVDALDGRGGNFAVPYNGVTVAALLQGKGLIQDSLSTATLAELDNLSLYNLISLNIKDMYINALREAVIDGSISEYDSYFFKRIAHLSSFTWPVGLPQTSSLSGKLNSAYALAQSKRKSLRPLSYSSGDQQRITQRYRIVPTDIDLCIPVQVRDGRETGIRFKNDDTIPIVTRVGVESIVQQNEFLSVATRDSTKRKLELASRRSEAYYLDNSDESIIQSLVGNRLYSIEMIVSSTTEAGSVSSVEFSAVPTVLPEAMLFSSMRETITDIKSPNNKLRSTSVKYKPAWDSSYETKVDNINLTTSAYSGPRISMVIPSDDPIWSYIIEGNDVELRFTDFGVPVGGGVLVRKILTDFMIFPTNKMESSSLKGRSQLQNFSAGGPPSRSISLSLSPRPQNKIGYVGPTLNPSLETASGEEDVNAMMFTNILYGGGPSSQLSKDGTLLSSSKSQASQLLDLISSVNDNYNLENGSKGKSLPLGDLTSLMSLNTYLKLLTRVPSSLIFDIFNGVYNDIKVFTVLFTDPEKTFLTPSRLKGDSLESQKTQTDLSEGRYFDNKYNRKLYRR